MKIFWFSDADGHVWSVFVAPDEASAWKMFGASLQDDDDVDNYELDSVTDLADGKVGQIAWILPLECTFALNPFPGSDE